MKAILLGAAAVLAMPALAQMADRPAGRWAQPTTRADAEAKAKAHFAERDTNHDGFITPEEIRAGAEARMGKMRDMAFDRLDADHNGSISREEFMARPQMDRMVERRIERGGPDGAGEHHAMHVVMMQHGGPGGDHMMMMADTDHDGKISQAEAVAGALKMFDGADANHDGTVTPDERHTAMEAWGAKMHDRMGDMMPPPPPPPVR
ncbi:MAG TPA: EF-hand domain-containing protein [Sphingomonas sp.]|nr:EF-hand domain-containing protein [Sphingomonas sp.]